MAREKQYEITLYLNDIHDLFATPPSDPFSERVHFVAGIEVIKSKIKPPMLKPSARVTLIIHLPERCCAEHRDEQVSVALQRYCTFKARQTKKTMDALKGDALKALLVGIVFLVFGIVVFRYLNILPEFLRTLLGDGFDIAFWVILWRPVDFLLFDLPVYQREYRYYQCIMTMPLRLVAESQDVVDRESDY